MDPVDRLDKLEKDGEIINKPHGALQYAYA
jgi:hypothetical protein